MTGSRPTDSQPGKQTESHSDTQDADRQQALHQVVGLVQQHGLTVSEIEQALAGKTEGERSRVVVKVLSYLGGVFVLAGIGTFVAMQWEQLNSAARVIITLGPGLTVFALAWIGSRDERFHDASTPLFVGAAGLIPTGIMVAFAEYGQGGDGRTAAIVTSATVALQFALAFAQLRRAVTLFFALAFLTFFVTIALDKIGLEGELIALTVGAMLMLLAIAVHRSEYAAISPAGFLFGSWALLWGLLVLVEGTVAELLFVAVASGLVYVGVLVRSRTLNFTSMLALLAYTAWFTNEHFADSVGWPLALIGFGMVMIVISAVALRIDRRYLRD